MELSDYLIDFVARRGLQKSCCPSEVARGWAVLLAEPDNWRAWMEPVREVARAAEQQGRLEWLQKGQRIDPLSHKGPVRLRALPRKD